MREADKMYHSDWAVVVRVSDAFKQSDLADYAAAYPNHPADQDWVRLELHSPGIAWHGQHQVPQAHPDFEFIKSLEPGERVHVVGGRCQVPGMADEITVHWHFVDKCVKEAL